MKRRYSGFTLKDALQLLKVERFTPWDIAAPVRPPSEHLIEDIRRFSAFDLENSESAKLLLMDALFAEIVPDYPNLKIWKSAPLESDTVIGVADYLIAPNRAYLATPLLCVAEAKKDDFAQGRAQCLTEIYACIKTNRADDFEADIFGIVSNGQVWQFYRRAQSSEIFESGLYIMDELPRLLGVLDAICAECSRQVPASGELIS